TDVWGERGGGGLLERHNKNEVVLYANTPPPQLTIFHRAGPPWSPITQGTIKHQIVGAKGEKRLTAN
ncbi:MAG: hypothetical protein WBZ19_26840, partial [Chthoniobacterales bacterium]